MLDDCTKYRVDVGEYPEIQKEYEVSCIPTVIIFDCIIITTIFAVNTITTIIGNRIID